MFILTIDLDWAQDFIIKDTLSLLDKYRINATIFCTHKTGIKFDRRHELGIHPNIRSINEADKKLSQLMKIYPRSIGIRSHALFSSYYLYRIYKKAGLRYESNYMMFAQPNIKVFPVSNILQFPIYFMDDVYLKITPGSKTKFCINEFLRGPENCLKIFAFHPIHIFMNTRSINEYERFKSLTTKNDLEIFRNTASLGIRDMFEALLSHINKKGIKTYTLKRYFKANTQEGNLK